ncbi:39S ribosomal protein L55, mitochondrial [Anthophora quadrimaculata]
MNISSFLRTTQTALSLRRSLNCWTAAITKPHRKNYFNTYPTILVLPDGSTIHIEYEYEPRKIIFLPIDLSALAPEERRIRLEKRRPVQKVKIVDEYQDDFDETEFFDFKK